MAASLPGLDSPSVDVPASTSAAISFTCRRGREGTDANRSLRGDAELHLVPLALAISPMPVELTTRLPRTLPCRTLCPAALPLPVLSLSTVSLMRHSGCSDTWQTVEEGGGKQGAGDARGREEKGASCPVAGSPADSDSCRHPAGPCLPVRFALPPTSSSLPQLNILTATKGPIPTPIRPPSSPGWCA